jgi:putative ABC transport system permease protein
VETAQHLIDRHVAHPRFRAVLLGSFAAIALMLAVVGLYAVLSQLVAHRSHEIGVRTALGARQRDVLALVVREGMLLAGLGATAGLVVASWLTRFLSSLLFGVPAGDPVTLSAVAALLLAATFLATYLPAKRAATVDPMVALRCE